MQRSNLPYYFLGLAALIALSAILILIFRPGVFSKVPAAAPALVETPETNNDSKPVTPRNPLPSRATVATAADSASLVAQIAQALEAGDLAKLMRLIGNDALDSQNRGRLTALSANPLRLRQPNGIREVGEIELNARSRWVLELDGPPTGRDQIFLDLRRQNGKWAVQKITFPPGADEPIPKAISADSLDVADAFLQAILKQDFERARAFVDPATVSDTKIAGLCILFEDAEYRLRKSKPLRAMFQRDNTTGYLANVETRDGKQSAQFALTLKQPAGANWIVSEINLNQLLADYASRVAGGDIYYTPLVKNPGGGDTLALYFEFDEDEMNPRTRRQLEIVTVILRSDPGKKITLSGHTDVLGTPDYNNSLSSRRADVVRDFLIKAGVDARQIVTVAKGAGQPRRPNFTESGVDDPEGRRANRRTEIYLDF